MTNKNSNVIIENGKVIFSQEILDYFENLRNEETSEWIDKYFEVLSDSSNMNSTKFDNHHIISCFTFKDENHKNRRKTKPLADNIKGNLIKLSIYNHILAHYYLWKIFKTENSRTPIILMSNNKHIEILNETQIKNIARIQEEYRKENMTDEEKIIRDKKWRNEHKKEMKEYNKEYRKNNKERLSEKSKEYYENNKQDKLIYAKKIFKIT